MAAMNINEQLLHELVESGKTILVDFWAPTSYINSIIYTINNSYIV